MKIEWTKLKSEMNTHVDEIKAKLQNEFKAEYEKKEIQILTKIKDNAKEATVQIINKNNPEAQSELQISLSTSQNLAKRFDSLLSDFKKKNS